MPIVSLENGKLGIAFNLADVSPERAFEIARSICDAAYAVQGGPARDPDERYAQQLAREKRKATWFEELHCTIRDIADDHHRETVRRSTGKEGGQFVDDYLDPLKAIDGTGRQVVQTIKDWDY